MEQELHEVNGVASHVGDGAEWLELWMTVSGPGDSPVAPSARRQGFQRSWVKWLLSPKLACPGLHNGWGAMLPLCQLAVSRYSHIECCDETARQDSPLYGGSPTVH